MLNQLGTGNITFCCLRKKKTTIFRFLSFKYINRVTKTKLKKKKKSCN